VGALDAEWRNDLAAKREWVRSHFTPEARSKYETVEGKLRLVSTILASGWVEAAETLKLQALGVVFGDALAQRCGLEWVLVSDQYGRDAALQLPGTNVIVFPLTSISKRVERGESVDVVALFATACDAVQRAAEDADR
jgi:hypothetical protein